MLNVQSVLEIGLDCRGDASTVAAAVREDIRNLRGFVGTETKIKRLVPTQTFAREASLSFVAVLSLPSLNLSPVRSFLTSCFY